MTTVQKIKEVEDEMAKTQKNKATSYHLGQLKAKLAKLRRELIAPPGGGGGWRRTSVGFVGFPSVGKSTLMSKLTGTHSEVSAIDFTTLTTVPGLSRCMVPPFKYWISLVLSKERMMDVDEVDKSLLVWLARTCNLIFIVLDVLKPLGDKKLIESELEGFGIRLNKRPPAILVRKKEKGGIAITNTVPLTDIDHDEIKAILSEYKINNADIAIREPGATADDLVDVIEGNRVYIPALYVLNKIDAISIEELDLLYKIPNSVPISSREWMNIDELVEKMWETLNLVRVYTKPRGLAPDYSSPVVLRRGKCTVGDFCNSIHKEIAKQMKYAIVWGASAKHSRGQKVGLDHVLEDEDVVHISKK
ncbi:P-loop containing nucleoside triphosphate hydrolase protein [Desarmillaria tabescens]|uniref:P-loop containing nucleoside triphosphate hydrolase protein n=1 Tax=Armillaria tabescens TaxID=1929756 RepID=A0AA39U0R4_ARMTA|nr:P-loop containing nucleoside triphosphate hydrolase protein [Desarmillaria tabescens]KAK0468329.1 P-loop containing nucleoside triphosphate hydrolase protein [Desarmillaria tabescens]